jgi:signal transduction histidine kinase
MIETAPKAASRFSGLSTKVLLLTIIFVLVGEIMIFLPSIANFRIQWMKTRIAQAEIASLAALAAPDAILDDALRTEILKGAGVMAVSLKRGGTRQLILRNNEEGMSEQTYDLRPGMHWLSLGDALSALVSSRDRIINIIDIPPNMSGEMIEVSLHEEPLTKAMRAYGLNILYLSIFLSVVVAAMIYAALNKVLVRPMMRLSANMTAFGDKPEDASRIISPSDRSDEIGNAERELHDMQTQLQSLLQQKNHLAALGLAVSKVSHDLRNMLTTAQVVSDSLGEVKDPQVQRFAPRLITSLDRAITFLTQTLKYGQAKELPPDRSKLNLNDVAKDVLMAFEPIVQDRISLSQAIDRSVVIDADREQLHRILTNLVRNATQAFEQSGGVLDRRPAIAITAMRRGSVTEIDVTDNGPGIPQAVRESLFEAFQSAAKPGGTGLGLAISRELAEAHGGSISVRHSNPEGTCFCVVIPDRVVELARHKKQA